ncbi:MAG: hypothetical protein ACLQGP_32310 [Isosphaeraceae bacterium]
MMTLDEAWDCYKTTKRQLDLLARIGWKHWDNLAREGEIGKDERLRTVESRAIIADTELSLEHLDDFAVLILFSAFESLIREQARSDVREARERLIHPLVTRILDEAIQNVEQGSIFRVLDVYKGQDVDIVEEVNQVRRYRNWVAHGRRGESPFAIDPPTVYERLKRFLDRFATSIPEER